MANAATITKLLTEAAGAYPAYDKTKLPQAMKFYIKALAGFDEKTLETAIEERIATSRWFPAVAELVETCRKVQSDNKPQYHIPAPDILRRELIGLERARTYDFDPASWGRLAAKLEKDDRVYFANHVRQKAGLPTVDYRLDEAAMIAHDIEYEAAHPFTGERWWEAT